MIHRYLDYRPWSYSSSFGKGVPFFCARFSNRVISFGSTTRPRRMKRVSFGGFSLSLSRFVLIMAMYSEALMYLVSRFHFLSCVLYCFSLVPERFSAQGHRGIAWGLGGLRCLEAMRSLHLHHDIF